MFNKLILCVLFCFISLSTFSQSSDSIQATKISGGYKYELNGNIMNFETMSHMMQNNIEATQLLNKAKGSSGFANVLGYVGGFLVGYPLGTALGGGQANWTLAAIGAGIFVIALPIASSANKNLKQAVDVYNSSLNQTSYKQPEYELKLGINPNGLGLTLNF
jgi:hypothetical protein